MDPNYSLGHILPAAAKALTPEQFTAGLTLATRLVEQGIDPSYTLEYGLPAIAQASPTSEAFQANLQALEGLVIRLATRIHGNLIERTLPPAAEVLTPEQFNAGLALASRLAERGIDPSASPGLLS